MRRGRARTNPLQRIVAWVILSLFVAALFGYPVLIAREGLQNRAEARCLYAPAKGNPPRQLGAWRWWPPGYKCANP
jgi:hypothetical protein